MCFQKCLCPLNNLPQCVYQVEDVKPKRARVIQKSYFFYQQQKQF